MKRRLAVAASLVFASLALSGCGAVDNGGLKVAWGTPAGSGASSASAPAGSVDMCAALSVAALNAASGRAFTSSKTFNNTNSWGCAYATAGHPFESWEVALLHTVSSDAPYLLIGSADETKPLDGTPYPAIGSKHGVILEWGKDDVLVNALSDSKTDYADAAHYTAAAEAAIAALAGARQ